MSSLPPLVNIVGMNRYDLPACTINAKQVANWQKIKNKLQLSEDETEDLFKLFKTKLHITVKENITSSSATISLSKDTSNEGFNNVIRDFIKTRKICSRCKCPELINYKCNACGHQIEMQLETKESKVEKKGMSKQERRAKKVEKMKQKSSERNQETESEDDRESEDKIVEVDIAGVISSNAQLDSS